jgi:hypothetical protein
MSGNMPWGENLVKRRWLVSSGINHSIRDKKPPHAIMPVVLIVNKRIAGLASLVSACNPFIFLFWFVGTRTYGSQKNSSK